MMASFTVYKLRVPAFRLTDKDDDVEQALRPGDVNTASAHPKWTKGLSFPKEGKDKSCLDHKARTAHRARIQHFVPKISVSNI